MARSWFGEPPEEQIRGLSSYTSSRHNCGKMENHHSMAFKHTDKKI